MKPVLKRLVIILGVLSLSLLTSCGSKKQEKEATPKEEEKVKIVGNKFYVEPLQPTNEQSKAYNQLSEAISKEDSKEEAKYVAVSFAYDFFMLSNKKNGNDIGGLQFIPSDKIKPFMEYAQSYYYSNYETIVNEYGKSSLPEVTSVSVDAIENRTFTYNKGDSEGYLVKLQLTYKDTKVQKLKKTMSVSLVRIQDFAYDRSKDYKGEVIHEDEMKNVYRVLAVED
ncbi:MAG: ferrichrome ABC transporter substrate-binding protein [Longicatena sp.]